MSSSREQQFLVGGFSLGLMAGAVGYYLFGTKQGKELRTELSQEWTEAQDYLTKQGIWPQSKKKTITLTQFFGELRNQILTGLELDLDDFKTQAQQTSRQGSHKKRLPRKKSQPKKFLGV